MPEDPLQNPYAPPAAPTAPQQDRAQGARASYRNERRSVLLVIGLTVITLGFYPAIWFLRRRAFIDSLDSTVKLGNLAAVPLCAAVVAFGTGFFGLPRDVDRAVDIAIGAASIVTAFRVARILRSDFARTGRFLSVSSAGTFFFGVLYLQYKINQAADTPPTASRSSSTHEPASHRTPDRTP
jgi:hypothetical protein